MELLLSTRWYIVCVSTCIFNLHWWGQTHNQGMCMFRHRKSQKLACSCFSGDKTRMISFFIQTKCLIIFAWWILGANHETLHTHSNGFFANLSKHSYIMPVHLPPPPFYGYFQTPMQPLRVPNITWSSNIGSQNPSLPPSSAGTQNKAMVAFGDKI